jgi:hypothetical protein
LTYRGCQILEHVGYIPNVLKYFSVRWRLKQRICLGLFLLGFLSGCVTNTTLADAHVSENNVNRLSRVSLRMDQETVLKIMHAPYDTEVFRVGEDKYDVWFYVTTVTVLGQSRMVPKNLTPLIFRNQTLVGVGYDYYHWLQSSEKPSRSLPSSESEVLENKGLERELEKSLHPKTSVPQQTETLVPTPSSPSTKLAPSSPAKAAPQQQGSPKGAKTNVQSQGSTPVNQESPPTDLKLGPPPPKPSPKSKTPPPSQPAPISMSKTPEKTSQTPAAAEQSEKPEWNEKDEEINEDAMDQDFDFW